MKLNLTVKNINKYVAGEFVQKYHYSKVFPRLTSHYLGFFQNKSELIGVVTLGFGTQPSATINKLMPGLKPKDYWEIGKMCLIDSEEKNRGSQVLSEVIKWIKINEPEKLFLYTLADGIVSKLGIQYQASNFYYGGYFYTDVYLSKEGEKIHPRSSKELCKENAKFCGKEKIFWLTKEFCKLKGISRVRGKMFRYIMPLSKKARKMLDTSSTVKWTNNDYPKEKDLEWKIQTDDGYKLLTEMPQMNLSVVNINKKNVESYQRKDNEFFG